MSTAAYRTVGPADCSILFGVPTSEQGFSLQAENPEEHDFIQSQRLTWPKYQHFFAGPCCGVLEDLRRWGVQVVEDARIEDLAAPFSEGRSVMILFAHWSEAEGSVELSDGVTDPSHIVASIPTAFEGILDLCVCHPQALVARVKADRPGCVVKYTGTTATPLLWLYMYHILFKLLNERPMNYFTALAQAFKTAAML